MASCAGGAGQGLLEPPAKPGSINLRRDLAFERGGTLFSWIAIRTERRDRLSLREIVNSPVNALSVGTGIVSALFKAITVGVCDPSVSVIAVRGETFLGLNG